MRYHRRGPWVLRGIDVHIGPGEVAVVLGRNGVGKSTLLQVAAGSSGRAGAGSPAARRGWVGCPSGSPPTSRSP
ncbi:ATP-binding cassette domain-containing protein [Micromonospora sp. M12]